MRTTTAAAAGKTTFLSLYKWRFKTGLICSLKKNYFQLI